MSPWPFRINEIGRKRRSPAPVVDAGVQELLVIRIGKIRRRLNVYLGHKQTRHSNRSQHFASTWLRPIRHWNLSFHAKILDDHFLDVPMALMEIADCDERIDAVFR